ncbi:MAG TPA: prolipoprotein diacylglyceryl transferase family protein [Chitinophaga sp.]|uniref:prolipoprotein diacylglyceryl transferase n=1 Tax=Chitinophaga sp. TaxID=1869181 RepID=UPI002BBB5C4C|nr:prolipoprotein diacylglyceryl transferase family protein [Chitinophaga sp.]HVI47362.1 prolipoprotein diacylglyceryl transferase family protein [Chitinophaga sp.]
MYPNLYYALRDLLGLEIPVLKIFQTFGFFVAVAFLAAAYVLTRELKRREKMGLMLPVQETITVGGPATRGELIGNGVIGFLLGWKIIGLMLNWTAASQDLQGYMLSGQGSFWAGLLVAAGFVYIKYNSNKKKKATTPGKEVVSVWPHQRVPDIVVMAAIAGLIGAKIFHNLENWNDFMQDPLGSLVSFSGLTFYGGLIVATVVILNYARKKQISIKQLIDSAAPALMLAYGIGRMGCQFAGDGDWGIYNSAYITDTTGRVVNVAPAEFNKAVQQNIAYFQQQYSDTSHIPHAAFSKPAALGFLPDWFFASGYPHNVIREGVSLPGCDGQYCRVLPVGVYPTPLYEIIACLLLFGVLWAIRRKVKIPGVLFGVYLVLNGIERFFIEKIRVNTKYDIFGFHPTQAEIISSLMVIGGIVFIWYCRKKNAAAVTLPR